MFINEDLILYFGVGYNMCSCLIVIKTPFFDML